MVGVKDLRRIHSLDYLKTFLALFVVLAHTNWLQNNMSVGVFVFGNGLLRMLVPLFCIIAGYFLQVSIARGKAGKWLTRVMGLYLFWMLAYLPIWHGQVTGFRSLATTLLWGFFHLWFLIGMFFGGLAVIALHWLGARIAPKHALWFVVFPAAVCGIIGVLLQYADLTGIADIPVQRYRNGIFMCFPFMALGFLLRSRIETEGLAAVPPRPQALALSALGIFLMAAEAWFVQAHLGTGVMIEVPLASYLAVPAIFLLALQVQMPPQPVDLGLVSASIYFLHIWAFRLAEFLDVHHMLGLMAFGIGLPTLIAMIYGVTVTRRSRRDGLAMPAPGGMGQAAPVAAAVAAAVTMVEP
ncbi:acyltransferase family protein [Paracoccus sp. DK608]|uniref:Acyltransferase family protein n=1 Tax=Paracoccus shanxieyensis TaxID=2675752 RepID=A0A6L6ISP1_9RHOB|nr:acyltransferase family protein [Paracoccus shanxieyensis]MTH86387.1 acyltransferase family protein [Paracoccus shanxieyensis]